MTDANKTRALEMYKQGLNDTFIGRELFYTSSGIRYWRKKNGLPPHTKRFTFNVAEAMELYNQGMNDSEIANELGLCKQTIWRWRKLSNLKSLYFEQRKRTVEFDTTKALELYNQGLSDGIIAKKCDTDARNVCSWRHSQGLEANFKQSVGFRK